MLSIKTNRGQTLSCGQAQKPWNVFLKVYVDWAGLPTPALAKKLAPHLHVPLDSVVMSFFAQEFREDYDARIARLRRQLIERACQRLPKQVSGATPRMIGHALLGSEFSLGMNKEIYLAWQEISAVTVARQTRGARYHLVLKRGRAALRC